MGGDHGPEIVIPGCAEVLRRWPDVRFTFYGRESGLQPLLAAQPELSARSSIVHGDVAIGMAEKPSQALRRGRRVSSMWMAVEAVKRGAADAAVSAGNTGALMAISKVCLRSPDVVERPAISCIWPTLRGRSIVLDVGATVGGSEYNLVQNAIMGAAMAQIVLDRPCPTVGLLNVGIEEIKGNEAVKLAGQHLADAKLPGLTYAGFIEGNDIAAGTVDVVVTDGFTGNIALKSSEGSLRQFAQVMREEIGRSIGGKLAYLIARRSFSLIRERMDPRRSNGGVLLGLNGLVVKSHGGADLQSFAVAVELACQMSRARLLTRVHEALAAAYPQEPVQTRLASLK